MAEVDFADTVPPDATLVRTPALEPSLLKDVARTFELLGVQTFRASLVDVESMRANRQWAVSDSGSVSTGDVDAPLESLFPNASPSIGHIAASDTDKTLTQQMGPRLWRFAWRANAQQAVISEAEFRARRDAVIDMDIALLRLVGSMGVRTTGDVGGDVSTSPAPLSPASRDQLSPKPEVVARQAAAIPQTTPISGVSARAAKLHKLPLVLLVATSILTGWLALDAAPTALDTLTSQNQEIRRQSVLAQNTLVLELSTAMASGDYGHVQTVLSSFASLGYFPGAVVTNTRERIVALAGRTERLRIGDPPPAELQQAASRSNLKLGSQTHGELMIFPPPVVQQPDAPLLGWAAWAAFTASVIATALLAARLRSESTGRGG